MEAVIFIGIQASGKSTFYKEKFFDTHVRINLDMLKTRHREKVLFQACLDARQPVVIDNTNPAPGDRRRYTEPARLAGFRIVGYYFSSCLEECKARNVQRPAARVVPLPGLFGTYRRLVLPSQAEGFDQLWHVKIDQTGEFVIKEWSDEMQ